MEGGQENTHRISPFHNTNTLKPIVGFYQSLNYILILEFRIPQNVLEFGNVVVHYLLVERSNEKNNSLTG